MLAVSLGDPRAKTDELPESVAVARNETALTILDVGDGAETVVLHIVDEVLVIEGLADENRTYRNNNLEKWHLISG